MTAQFAFTKYDFAGFCTNVKSIYTDIKRQFIETFLLKNLLIGYKSYFVLKKDTYLGDSSKK